MKLQFSFTAARWTIALHIVVFGLLATIPDLIWPELEFGYYWRDTVEAWLLGLALLLRAPFQALSSSQLGGPPGPLFILGLILAMLLCSVFWGAVVGLLWPRLRSIGLAKFKSRLPAPPA